MYHFGSYFEELWNSFGNISYHYGSHLSFIEAGTILGAICRVIWETFLTQAIICGSLLLHFGIVLGVMFFLLYGVE